MAKPILSAWFVAALAASVANLSGCSQVETDVSNPQAIETDLKNEPFNLSYADDEICRSKCGLSRAELFAQDLTIKPGNIATRTFPDNYLTNSSDIAESHRLTQQKIALDAINRKENYIRGIYTVFYLKNDSVSENTYSVYYDTQLKNYDGPYLSDTLRSKVLGALAEGDYIQIVDRSDRAIQTIKIKERASNFAQERKIFDQELLVLTIPLFDIGDTPASSLLYLPDNGVRQNCEVPNTYFVREIFPQSEFAAQLLNLPEGQAVAMGRFSSCVSIIDWTGRSTLPILEQMYIYSRGK